LIEEGVLASDIYLIGFSQGACLSLEFAAQNAQKIGGVVAFTGGLIGEQINRDNYQGDFEGTPVLISGSQQDMHVPLERMQESESILTKHGAKVKLMTLLIRLIRFDRRRSTGSISIFWAKGISGRFWCLSKA